MKHSKERLLQRRVMISPLFRAMTSRMTLEPRKREGIILRSLCALDALLRGRGDATLHQTLQIAVCAAEVLCAMKPESAGRQAVNDVAKRLAYIVDYADPCPYVEMYVELCACVEMLEKRLLDSSEEEVEQAFTANGLLLITSRCSTAITDGWLTGVGLVLDSRTRDACAAV